MADKKTPGEESVSGGMTEREAMQRVTDLQARQRESGGPGQPLPALAEPPMKSETTEEWAARIKELNERKGPLTLDEANELMAATLGFG